MSNDASESHEPDIRAGATALRKYLADIEESIPVFCEKHGLDRITIQRYLNGERQRISVDVVIAIERATHGAVPVQLWEKGAELPPTGTNG